VLKPGGALLAWTRAGFAGFSVSDCASLVSAQRWSGGMASRTNTQEVCSTAGWSGQEGVVPLLPQKSAGMRALLELVTSRRRCRLMCRLPDGGGRRADQAASVVNG